MYVRKNPSLRAKQQRPFATKNVIWVKINAVIYINVYRQLGNNVGLI